MPSVSAVRPSRCRACGAASQPLGRKEVARLALAAAYPDVTDRDPPLERRAACAVVDASAALVVEVHRYRLALARARNDDRDDLLPF